MQAAIAACHASAPSAAATDWEEIVALYDQLDRMVPSPVVALNRAVAIAMAQGPAAGLTLVDQIGAGGELADYHLLEAVRGDLLRRQGRDEEAASAYRRALERAPTDTERRYLARRIAHLTSRDQG